MQSRGLALRKIIRHAGVPKLAVHLFAGHSDNVVDFVQLIELVFTRKQRVQCEYLVENAANGPDVDFGVVIASREQ